jgi:hypothetical protein
VLSPRSKSFSTQSRNSDRELLQRKFSSRAHADRVRAPLTRLDPPLDRLYAGRRFVLRAKAIYADNVHENDARVEFEFTPRK